MDDGLPAKCSTSTKRLQNRGERTLTGSLPTARERNFSRDSLANESSEGSSQAIPPRSLQAFAGKAAHTSRARGDRCQCIAASIAVLFHLDGKQHANWQQFLGRFHPLAVHLPIGFLVLLPLLEIAGRRRPALREAAGFVLTLAFLSSVGALTLGYLLAYGSGAQGATVVHHMWGGIALTIGVLLCLLARRKWVAADASRIYPMLLTVVLLLLVYTAHQGGSLTHGGQLPYAVSSCAAATFCDVEPDEGER